MYLTLMPDLKARAHAVNYPPPPLLLLLPRPTPAPSRQEHLAETGARFGSLVAVAHSASKDPSLHHALVSALGALCAPREKSDEQKRLEQEMHEAQVERTSRTRP